jgi:hypothetical protein
MHRTVLFLGGGRRFVYWSSREKLVFDREGALAGRIRAMARPSKSWTQRRSQQGLPTGRHVENSQGRTDRAVSTNDPSTRRPSTNSKKTNSSSYCSLSPVIACDSPNSTRPSYYISPRPNRTWTERCCGANLPAYPGNEEFLSSPKRQPEEGTARILDFWCYSIGVVPLYLLLQGTRRPRLLYNDHRLLRQRALERYYSTRLV